MGPAVDTALNAATLAALALIAAVLWAMYQEVKK